MSSMKSSTKMVQWDPACSTKSLAKAMFLSPSKLLEQLTQMQSSTSMTTSNSTLFKILHPKLTFPEAWIQQPIPNLQTEWLHTSKLGSLKEFPLMESVRKPIFQLVRELLQRLLWLHLPLLVSVKLPSQNWILLVQDLLIMSTWV